MNSYIIAAIAILALVLFVGFGFTTMMGEGAFKRMTTVGGVYAVCKPDNYPVVCFLDADSDQGGLSCVPLSSAGGTCLK